MGDSARAAQDQQHRHGAQQGPWRTFGLEPLRLAPDDGGVPEHADRQTHRPAASFTQYARNPLRDRRRGRAAGSCLGGNRFARVRGRAASNEASREGDLGSSRHDTESQIETHGGSWAAQCGGLPHQDGPLGTCLDDRIDESRLQEHHTRALYGNHQKVPCLSSVKEGLPLSGRHRHTHIVDDSVDVPQL